MLYALAAVLINNALAGVIRVLGVLTSAPQLLRLALAILGLAAGQLRLAFLAIALTFRRSTQREEDYPSRRTARQRGTRSATTTTKQTPELRALHIFIHAA